MSKFCLFLSTILLVGCVNAELSKEQLAHLDNVAAITPELVDTNIVTKNDILIKNGYRDFVELFEPSIYWDNCKISAKNQNTLFSLETKHRAMARLYEKCLEAKQSVLDRSKEHDDITYAIVPNYGRIEFINASTCACFSIKFTEIGDKYSCSKDFLIELATSSSPVMQKTRNEQGKSFFPVSNLMDYISEQCFLDIQHFDTSTKEDKNRKESMKSQLKVVYLTVKQYCDAANQFGGVVDYDGVDCDCFAKHNYALGLYEYMQQHHSTSIYSKKDEFIDLARYNAQLMTAECRK